MKRLILLTLWTTTLFAAQFPFALAEKIEEKNENWIFSPYSISTCLAMAEMGAKGPTSEQMKRILNLETATLPSSFQHKPNSKFDFDLRIVQGLWVNNEFSLLDSYSDALKNTYQAVAERVDFSDATRNQINSWIAENTENKIQNIIADLNPLTQLILANAIYFKGSWLHPFPSQHTHRRFFYSPNHQKNEIPFMDQIGSFEYAENEDAQAVLLPFCSESPTCRPVCLIILPKRDITMTEELYESLFRNMTFRRVHILLPKLTLNTQVALNPFLKSLGMEAAFSDRANFSNIDGRGEIKLSDVLHKSYFDMDEKGIEAAAATVTILTTSTSVRKEEPIISFNADHPFYLFLLDNKSETLLFFGKYQKP